jgi:hypothetical protein
MSTTVGDATSRDGGGTARCQMSIQRAPDPGRPRAATPAGDRAPGASECERAYNSFVVRLWHPRGEGRLLRAEIEHVQSGQLERAAEVDLGWILARVVACLTPATIDPGTPSACTADDE